MSDALEFIGLPPPEAVLAEDVAAVQKKIFDAFMGITPDSTEESPGPATPDNFKPPAPYDHGDGTVTIHFLLREENGEPVFGSKRVKKAEDPGADQFEERTVEVQPTENLAAVVPLWAHDGWEITDTKTNAETKERWITMRRPKGYQPLNNGIRSAMFAGQREVWVR